MNPSSPHSGDEQLAKYQTGQLSAADILVVSDHLVDCPTCRAVLARTAKTTESRPPGADLPAALANEPASYEEMAALLDGTLSKNQSAEVRARLAASPQATAEFADLQRFRDQSVGLAPKIHGPWQAHPGKTAALAEGQPAPGKVIGFPTQFWRSFAALGAAAVLLLSGGWWFAALKPPQSATSNLLAEANLSSLPGDLRRDVEQAASTGIIPVPPWSEELSPRNGLLAGAAPASGGFRQMSPVGTVVREDRPTLRWTARDGATGYVVYLVDKDGHLPMLHEKVPGDRTDWTPSSPLVRGILYEWQVEARRGGEIIDRVPQPPAPEARFQVLDDSHAAELARLDALYPQNPLVLGTAYARVGLSQAATTEFVELAGRYPRSAVAQRLLVAVRAKDEPPK